MADQIYSGRAPSQGLDSSQNVSPRRTTYGDSWTQILSPSKDGWARDGRYYVVTNPTISTAVAFNVSATFSDTAPMFAINNLDPIGNGRTISLDYLRLLPTVAPASGTSMRVVVKTDTSLRIPTAGGGGNLVPQNTNNAYPNDAAANVQSGTGGALLTVPAAVNGRVVCNATPRASIPVVLETIGLAFGNEYMADGTPTTATSAMATLPPVCIPPQTSACIYIWFPSNASTGISAEFELTFAMR